MRSRDGSETAVYAHDLAPATTCNTKGHRVITSVAFCVFIPTPKPPVSIFVSTFELLFEAVRRLYDPEGGDAQAQDSSKLMRRGSR